MAIKINYSAAPSLTRLHEEIGCKDVFARPLSLPLTTKWNYAQQAVVAMSRVKASIPDLTSEDFEASDRDFDRSDISMIPHKFKLYKSTLGRELTNPSNHRVLVAALRAFAEAAGINKPQEVSIHKDHTRLSFMFGPKIYMVLPDRASAEKVMAHAHPHNFLHPA